MCFYMDNYSKYKEKILNANKLNQEKKDYYLNVAKRVYDNGFPIILNSYHLSVLIINFISQKKTKFLNVKY